MGSTEQYCLRWNDFQSNITGAFSDIRDNEDFLDVTLVSDGQTVRAHKLVLSACSPLFRAMLKKNAHPQPMIFLHGVRYADISAILNFMYHGEVNVNQEDLQTFLSAAEELRIRGLSDRSGAVENNTENGDSDEDSGADANASKPQKRPRLNNKGIGENTTKSGDKSENKKRSMVVTPDLPSVSDYQDTSSNHSENFGVSAYPYDASGASGANASLSVYGSRNRNRNKDESGSPNGLTGLSLSESWSQALSQEQQQQQLAEQQQHHLFLSQQLLASSTAAAMRAICPYCHKELKNSHSLNVHISRYHSGGNQMSREVICPVCKRKYGNKYSLRTHMHLNHKDQLHLLGGPGRRGKKPGGNTGTPGNSGEGSIGATVTTANASSGSTPPGNQTSSSAASKKNNKEEEEGDEDLEMVDDEESYSYFQEKLAAAGFQAKSYQ